ncbi:hypothetical protein K493DRAFT_407634 [Basidiobolus meristosporus CBS 931.73]|uniref:PAS domain-containing protein n=1 Tax=Basidiobolus meristosporus CBS 931.73 TaxID=1314790 RepID=A0A1Y1YCM1_9FUNG|nr:hypothetical protein K493DRAFT_407634 [Basidiobolus meristosporus CBS 931.73]|eukprot:ORX95364.1 hypothetical protein K493DRAFT_407634 [Basidiobolus meristosporus CBS 931.73]
MFILAHRLAHKEKLPDCVQLAPHRIPKSGRPSRGGTALEFIHPLAHPTEYALKTKPEPRIGLVLNRFSYFCYVQYCSDLVGYMFGISQRDILGNSFYNYVHEEDTEKLEEEITKIKVNNGFCVVSFTFVSAYGNVLVQGCFSATMDGIVGVLRPGNTEFVAHPCKYNACSNQLDEKEEEGAEERFIQMATEVKKEN